MSVNFIVTGGDASFDIGQSSDAASAQLRSDYGGSLEAEGLQYRERLDLSLPGDILPVHGCRYFKSILELLARL